MIVKLPKYNLSGEVVFGRYHTGETAITLMSEEEGTIAVPTVNLEAWGSPRATEGTIWIKTWSENEGIDRALLRAGVIKTPFLLEEFGGYGGTCRAVLAELTDAAKAELKAQEEER